MQFRQLLRSDPCLSCKVKAPGVSAKNRYSPASGERGFKREKEDREVLIPPSFAFDAPSH